MKLSRRLSYWLLASFCALALALGITFATIMLQSYGGINFVMLKWQEWIERDDWQGTSIWLPDFRVEIEAYKIEGLHDDLSALTYDPDRNTLFTVTNNNPEIIELDLKGHILRRIKLLDFGDTEAIEYLWKDTYLLTDERKQRLIKVRIEEHTETLKAGDSQQLALGIGLNGNKGFEGLAYDSENQRVFVGKERDPVRIYEISGFPHTDPDKPLAVGILDDPDRNAGLFIQDLSSLQYDPKSGHLLALSDESHLLLEFDINGRPISSLSLHRGQHGLKRSIRQAEGVAMDKNGALYLVSEPNLFYVFRKPAP